MVEKVIKYFENGIVYVLLALLAIFILATTFELCVYTFQQIFNPASDLANFLSFKEMLNVLGFFFTIIITLELFETIHVFLHKHVFPAQAIMLVAITAVARKIIILDYKETEPIVILGIAALIASLAVGYYFVKKIHIKKVDTKELEHE